MFVFDNNTKCCGPMFPATFLHEEREIFKRENASATKKYSPGFPWVSEKKVKYFHLPTHNRQAWPGIFGFHSCQEVLSTCD